MNCQNHHKTRARERHWTGSSGAALIVAMLIFAIATALVVAMSSEFTLLMRRTGNSSLTRQAHAYLRGGEDLARAVLRADRNRTRDTLSDNWAQQLPPYALDEGGWLSGRLEDLQGRFNLNSVGDSPSARQQFVRLLQTPARPRISRQQALQIAEALRDWLDADDEPLPLGAEDDYYRTQTPPYRAGNAPMRSVSELRLVAHMTPELYAAVAPHLTALPLNSPTPINIQTASAGVLRSINCPDDLAPLSAREGEDLLELRGSDGFADKDEILVYIDCAKNNTPDLPLSIKSDWFLYSGVVEVAGRPARLYSILHRKEGEAGVSTVLRTGSYP